MTKAKIRRKNEHFEEDLIFRYVAIGSYHPVTTEISVYDRKENNVVIKDEHRLASTPPIVREFTVETDKLNEIKKSITDSGVMKIKPFEESPCLITDGEFEELYFSDGAKRISIACDDFFISYQGCKEDSSAGIVIKLYDRICELLGIEQEDEEELDDD